VSSLKRSRLVDALATATSGVAPATMLAAFARERIHIQPRPLSLPCDASVELQTSS